MLRVILWLARRLAPDRQPGPVVAAAGPATGPPPQRPGRRPLPRVPRWARWAVAIAVIAVVFRRAVAWTVLGALSAALHLFGVPVHLPHVSFGWPWQSVTSGTATNTPVGPLVLRKIQAIDKPALATESFTFMFTHKVSRDLGVWPCWYSATFYAVGHASATVNLNPGPAWWKRDTGHYQVRVLREPAAGAPGRLAVTMALPLPQLPQSVHQVSVDNTLSEPVSTSHSWTYPGLGCGVLIRPQFAQSVLYAQAQREAFYQATHRASISGPLIAAAKKQAETIIADNFITPAAGALGYQVSKVTIRWVGSG